MWFPQVTGKKKQNKHTQNKLKQKTHLTQKTYQHHTFCSENSKKYIITTPCISAQQEMSTKKTDITKVYGSLQSAWALLLLVRILRKQH